ncbi:MAG: inositol monophosphatase family protein [Reyranellales bacterium]
MLGSGDSQRVADLIRETAAVELLPRFRNLAKDDVRQKRPGDFVTVADLAAEQRLVSGLAKILPGVPVVGEEAVEKDPSLVDLIARPGETCWIVDPLDGTANFAAGKETFAVIVCLVHDRQAIAGWILDVPGGRMAIATKGQGVTLEGVPVRGVTTGRPPDGLVGYKIRKQFDRQFPTGQRGRLGKLTTMRCAGREYLEILSGRAGFCLYGMTKPWDHAAGALMMAEAGGGALQFGGKPYQPAQGRDSGIIGAATQEVLAEVSTVFEALQMPLLSELT